MERKLKPFLIIAFVPFLFFLIFFLKKNKEKNGLNLKRDYIEKTYRGVITNKVSPNRKGRNTHIEILTDNNEKLLISPKNSTLNELNIGDSIYKPKNKNHIYLFKNNKKSKLEYIYLSEKMKKNLSNKHPQLNI